MVTVLILVTNIVTTCYRTLANKREHVQTGNVYKSLLIS